MINKNKNKELSKIQREKIEQAKRTINAEIEKMNSIAVQRILESDFSTKRKRFEISRFYNLSLQYLVLGSYDKNPIDYLESIGC